MFEYHIEPRLSETDALGHINNTVLPVWFEEARKELFRIFNPSLSQKTWNLILKKYEIEFMVQIEHSKIVNVITGIEHIGSRSFVVHQIAKQNGVDVAIGKTVMIYFDYQTSQTAEIPPEIQLQLEKHSLNSA